MVTKVRRWGNGQRVRLSQQVLKEARMAVGDEVEVTAGDGVIVVTFARCVRGKYCIEDLVARIPKDYQPEEYGWGPPKGRQVW